MLGRHLRGPTGRRHKADLTSAVLPPLPHVPPLPHHQDDTHLYIITPYMAGGDLLERVLRLRSAIPPSEARRFFTHIVQGLQHLKGKDIAHGCAVWRACVCVSR
jgi:serine/threonine protein kinase